MLQETQPPKYQLPPPCPTNESVVRTICTAGSHYVGRSPGDACFPCECLTTSHEQPTEGLSTTINLRKKGSYFLGQRYSVPIEGMRCQLPEFAAWALCCEFFEELHRGGSSDLFYEGDRAAGDDFQFDFRIFGDENFSQASATLVFFLCNSLGRWLEFH